MPVKVLYKLGSDTRATGPGSGSLLEAEPEIRSQGCCEERDAG